MVVASLLEIASSLLIAYVVSEGLLPGASRPSMRSCANPLVLLGAPAVILFLPLCAFVARQHEATRILDRAEVAPTSRKSFR